MVAREGTVEAHVLSRHVASDARASSSLGVVVGVVLEPRAIGELGVATGAGRVARGRGERAELLTRLGAVRIVAGRARHRPRAPAEEKVARLSRVDVASPGGRVAAPP